MKRDFLTKIDNNIFEIATDYKQGMRVPSRIYASEELIANMDDSVLNQLTNVAMLPGIKKYSICMPDGHSGYGFPIGGVAAIDPEDGVISPGGIGFDINCGVRLLATALTLEEVKPVLHKLVDSLYLNVPAGVGKQAILSLSPSKFDDAMVGGAGWALANGYAEKTDLEYIEDGGAVSGADPSAVSDRARARGKSQIGTLGSGNHYLELQVSKNENIYNRKVAANFGITGNNQILLMIHTGSRGFGHQVATDYLKIFHSVMNSKYRLNMPDRELACAPFFSSEGQNYYKAMNCAINIAFLNRQLIMHRVREVFSDIFKKSPEEIGIRLIYDVCHNTAKLEEHTVDGEVMQLLVHRKGATRAFPPGMKGIPPVYSASGQPVLIGGSMQTGSYVLAGVAEGKDAFYTTAHGSGRVMSRTMARKKFNGHDLQKTMLQHGIYVKAASYPGLAEEAGGAYKDIDEVVRSTHLSGLSKPVAKLEPLGNIKG